MRPGFREIVSGWMLISGLDDLTDRIERAAAWTEANGPLEPDEEVTITLMIESQIARGLHPDGEYHARLGDGLDEPAGGAPGTLAPAERHLVDAWSAAVEKWIEGTLRGGVLEPQLLDLREALPALFDCFVAELLAPPEPPA